MGTKAHEWPDSLRSPAVVLQMGHVGVLESQASRHLAWKVWLQAGRVLHFSPPLFSNSSRQTAHDESVHDDPPTSNSTHGSFCSSAWDKPRPGWASQGLRRRRWALPAIQRWRASRNTRAPNNNKTDNRAIDCHQTSLLPEAALLFILMGSEKTLIRAALSHPLSLWKAIHPVHWAVVFLFLSQKSRATVLAIKFEAHLHFKINEWDY